MMFMPLIIILLFWYFIKGNECCSNVNKVDAAIEILNNRLANGELSEEEYELKKRLIKN